MEKYLGKKRLIELSERLNKRETQILLTLNFGKFMTSDQLQRQCFTGHKTELSAKRAANRTMKKLEELGLVKKMPRRVGGSFQDKNGGSSVSVWGLTESGYKILRMKHTELPPGRKRETAPNPLFLTHQLMISEVATQFHEMEHTKKIEKLSLSFEPKAWRGFQNRGESINLKPDLYASFVNGGYEEAYFIEVDRSTESLPRIFAKCQTYVAYFNTGIEEEISGVTPYIVWIVPDKNRAEQILKLLQEKMPEASVLFQVIVLEELKTLIVGEDQNVE